MNVESLAALTAGSINPAATAGRSSSTDKLSKSEIAGLLSGLSEDETSFAMAKYVGDESAASTVVLSARRHALSMAKRKAWKINSNQVEALADIAVVDSLSPCRCKRCGGIGHKLNKVCTPCNGTGFKHSSARDMARLVGIDETAFRKGWMEKLCEVAGIVLGWDSSVRQHVFLNGK